MKTKFLNLSKKLLITIAFIIALGTGAFIAFDSGLFKSFASTDLNENMLNTFTTPIEIYDINSNLISDDIYLRDLVNIDDLPSYTLDCFICTEDKDFYKHKGINYRSVLRAVISNLKSGSYTQGASTISQQLIKNTHLDGKKTLSRKLNEALLTQQLESKYTKKEILQSYLNAIYFGKGTFGIEKASKKYFSKSAKDLSIGESATLAGLIKSPKKYSPIDNYNACKSRRNIVLNNLYLAKKITKTELENELKKEIPLNISDTDLGENNYNAMAIKEASKILNMREQDVICSGYKIYTNQNVKYQNALQNLSKDQTEYDKLMTIIDNKSGAILAYCGNSKFNLANKKMQPGSVFKPIAVYAPALENGTIMTCTPILDEEINIDGYSPKNFDNKYHGYVSAKTALAKSYNIPAVKVLEYLGIKNSKAFVKKFGIDISEDYGYSIALGGLKSGVNFLDMASSYTAFGNNGKLSSPNFIRKIENKYGRTIYQANTSSKQVMSEDTAFLITDMLRESVNNGTAKKLKNSLNNVASKTGTAGTKNGNTDTWNITYTPKYTTAVWIGSSDNTLMPKEQTGSGKPSEIARKIVKMLDDKTTFLAPKTITQKYISTIDLEEQNLVKLATPDTLDRYKKLEYFSSKFCPKEFSNVLETPKTPTLKASLDGDIVALKLNTKPYMRYNIYRKKLGADQLVAEIEDKSGEQIINDKIDNDQMVEYYVKYTISGQNSQNIKNTEPIKVYRAKPSLWE